MSKPPKPGTSTLLPGVDKVDAEAPLSPPGPVVVDARYYQRKRELASGGMGQTFTAVDSRLGRRVVLKELKPPATDDLPGMRKRLRARLQQEARILAGLLHPNIVTVYEAGQWKNGDPFYAMRHVQGRELGEVVEEMPDLQQRMRLLPSLISVVEAVAYAHSRGVVHRDLTPKNILIGDYGDAVIIDWGISKVLDGEATSLQNWVPRSDGMTAAGMGVPAYAPPEQIGGKEPDERCDIYSLGVTMHFWLSGQAPFAGDSLEQILGRVVKGQREPLPEEIPQELQTIVAKAMSPQREERYSSARELADELSAYQAGGLVLAHRYSALERTRMWVRRRRVPLVVALAAVVAIAAVVGVQYFQRQSQRARQQSLQARQQSENANLKKRQAEQAQQRSDRLRKQAQEAAQKAGKTAEVADNKAVEARKRAEALRKALAATRKQRASALRSRTRALALARQERELKDAAEKARLAAVTAAAEAKKARETSLSLASKSREAQKKAVQLALSAQQAADQATTRARSAEAAASKAKKELAAAKAGARDSAKKLLQSQAQLQLARQQQALQLKQHQQQLDRCVKEREDQARAASEARRQLTACRADHNRPADPAPRPPPPPEEP